MIRLPALVAAVVAGGLALTGCSGSDEDPAPADGSSGATAPSSTASSTPYLPVPEGVELTEPGSQLAVGDHAVVAYHPRQEEVAALDLQVVRLEKTSIKDFSAWQLSDAQKESNPYYVRVRVENVGETDLGGRPVPLYVVNDANLLLEPTPFASSFKPCPSTPLPEKFGPGDVARACLVYLAPNHGDLVSVSFRPEETFNPITWSGEIKTYVAPKPAGDSKTGGGKAGKGGTRGGKGGTRGG